MAFKKLTRTLRLKLRKRLYVMSLFALATMTWSVLFTGGILFGFLPSDRFAGVCQLVIESEACRLSSGLKHTSKSATKSSEDTRSVRLVAGDIQIKAKGKTHDGSQETIMQLKRPLALSVPLNNSTPSSIIHPKIILRWTKFYGSDWGVPAGAEIFTDLNCAENRCILTDDRSQVKLADAVLVHIRDISEPEQLPRTRVASQRWIMHTVESPYHSEVNLSKFNGYFNWTSTYSDESDIPSPYGEYIADNVDEDSSSVNFTREKPPSSTVALHKTRLAAWFVTNCRAQNRRERYITELQRYLHVDVYGICGKLKCKDPNMCLDMLKQRYQFYIAFENSGCKQYITEKFWGSALQNDVIPIVMGAPVTDYEKYAPPHSFIHVDSFSSPKELARRLKILSKNTKLYSEYFNWKNTGKAMSYINMKPSKSKLWCNLCRALHDKTLPRKTYWKLDKWWSVESQCVNR